jgi:hypothetical protein
MRLQMWALMALALSSGAMAQTAQNPIESLFSPRTFVPDGGNLRDDPARRRLALPSIRAATDCVAKEALNEPGLPQAFARGELAANLTGPLRRCAGPLRFMITEQDRIYGQGSGRGFFDGPYTEDLPRAIIARIGKTLARMSEEAERQQAERQLEADREAAFRQAEAERLAAERRAEAQRVAAERQGEADRRDAERKVELARLESERRAEQLKQEDLKRQRTAAIEGANNLLRDRVLECVGREMRDLVRSGETADVLATATMTICSAEIHRFLDGVIDLRKIEAGLAYVGDAEKTALRTAGRVGVRDQVVAIAVKAKASLAKPAGSTF